LNRQTTYSYGSGATTITDPNGNVTVQHYQNGQLTSLTRASGTPITATWTFSYDSASLGMTSMADPNGHTWSNTWDSSGNLLSQTDPLLRVTTYSYDSNNNLLTVTDPLQVTTMNTYDANGNLKSSSTPLVGTTQVATVSYGYDPARPGDLTQVTDPDGKIWTFAYDQYGNRVKAVDPLSDTSTYAYDLLGRKSSEVSPKGNVAGGNPLAYTTSYTYNAFGDPTSASDPLGHQTSLTYDGNRNLLTETDANNLMTINSYDLDNQLTQVTRADGSIVKTTYDANGNVTGQTNALNQTTSYGYDALNRLVSTTDPLGHTTTFAYDGAGNRLTQQDPGGSCSATPPAGCTNFTYDSANELKAIAYSDGSTANVTGISYDADGQRIGMTDGTGTSSWVWDSLHRLTSYTNGAGSQIKYAYNLRSLPTTITYPGTLNLPTPVSLTVSRGYDDSGRLTSVQDWLGNATSFGYDPNSNLTTETLPAATGVVDAFTYDAADRLMGIADTKGANTLFAASYGRDNADQLTSDSSATSGAGSYRYTLIDQLCYAGSSNSAACTAPPSGATTYSYDPGDNIIGIRATVQTFNAANQLCWSGSASGSCPTAPSGATTYTYDARGNRTRVSPPVAPATNLSYDRANRLTAYGSLATYAYNGDGLRMSKTLSGTTSQFVWDVVGNQPMPVEDGVIAYVYGPDGLPLEQVNGLTALWVHHDQLGSTRLVTDSAGTAQATFTFDSYGTLVASTGVIAIPLKFGGQYLDTESGLYYLRARYYDPSTGQFLSRDPLAATTRQPYGYVANSPLNATDPSGLAWWNEALSWGFGQAAGAVGGAHDYLIQTQTDLEAGVFNGDWGCGAIGVGRAVAVASLFVGVGGLIRGGIRLLVGREAAGSIGSTGRTLAGNLREKLAMEQAMSNPSAGVPLRVTMTDPRWPAAAGWVKMSQNINGIEIHYVRNLVSGAVDDFKYVDGTP
jgi:RHS repeat-associated protein